MKLEEAQQGMQIAYIPSHANGDINHKDVEFGFVTGNNHSKEHPVVWCRYWVKGEEGSRLRTTSCSEGTNPNDLVPHSSCTKGEVEYHLNACLNT